MNKPIAEAVKAAPRLEVSLSKKLFWPSGLRKEALRCHDGLLDLVQKSMLQILFELLTQANIKPRKGSWEGVILSKRWVHYHWQKLHVSYRCHQTDQKCSFQPFWFEMDVISLKWKTNNSPNLKYFFFSWQQIWWWQTELGIMVFPQTTEHRDVMDSHWMIRPWVPAPWAS